jgi:hypothetical protein
MLFLNSLIMNPFKIYTALSVIGILFFNRSVLKSQSCNNLRSENIEVGFDWGASYGVNVSIERHRFSLLRPRMTDIRYRKDGTSTWTNRSLVGRLVSNLPSIEYSYDCLFQFTLPADGSLYEMQARLDCDVEGTGNWINKNFRMPCTADRTDDFEDVDGNTITIEDDFADEGWLSDDEGRTFFRKVNFQNGRIVFADLAENYTYQFKQRIRCDDQSWSNFSSTVNVQTECYKPRNNEISFNLRQMDSRIQIVCAKPASMFEFKYRKKPNGLWESSGEIARSEFTIPDAINPGDIYEIQCRVACGQWSYWTDWSNILEYTVPVECLKPVTDFGSKDITNHDATLYCRSEHQGGVVESHKFRFRKTGNTDWNERESLTNSYTLSNLDPNTEYEFEIQHQCVANFNSRWSNTKHFVTERNCEPTSDVIEILNVSYSTALLRCIQTEREGYVWDVKRVSDGRRIITTSLQTDNEYQLDMLEQGEEYEIRLKIYCNPDYSNYTDAVSFTTLECSVPELSDVSVSDISNTSANFVFLGNILSGIDWQFRKMGNANWKKSSSRVSNTLIDSLVANTDYEFRCRSKCNDNPPEYSEWCEIQYFKTRCNATISNFSDVSTSQITVHANNAHADEYSFRYRMSGAGLWTQSANITSRQFTASNLQDDTEYEFQVQSICDNVFSSWSVSEFISTEEIMSQPCSRPGRLNVAASNINTSSARLNNYRSNVDAYYFRYLVGTDWVTSPELNVGYFDINGLIPDTRYLYQAQVKCGNTLSEWSDTLRFRTLEVVFSFASGCFEPYVSQLFPLFISSNGALLLCYENDANQFQFRYKDTSSTVWIETAPNALNRMQINNLNPNTVYEFQCRLNCNSNFGAYSKSRYFKTQAIAKCLAPSTDNFAMLRIGTDHAQALSLNLSTIYQFRYRAMEDSIWTYLDTSTNPLVTLVDLKQGTDHAIQMRNSCINGEMSDFSNVKLFTTLPYCPSVLQTDITIEEIEMNSASLKWKSIAEAYLIRYRKTGDTTWVKKLLYLDTTYNLRTLDPNTDYEVQILAICDENNIGQWSTLVKFKTRETTASHDIENVSIQLAPNPVDTHLNLISDKELIDSQYAIYNIYGKLVMIGHLDRQNIVNVENLYSGLYFFKIIYKDQKQQVKFIKM